MNLYRLIGFIALGGLSFFSCNVKATSNNNNSINNAQQLKISNSAISGWVESSNPDSFCIMNSAELENGGCAALDGGAGTYTNGGFVQAMFQDMAGPSGEAIKYYVMQYTDSAAAAEIYGEALSTTTPIDSMPGYAKSVAFGSYVLGGAAYAHLGKFFFLLSLDGFANQTLAFQSASQFLTLFQSEIGAQ